MLAVLFPDLRDYQQPFEVLFFWIEHVLILLVPVYVILRHPEYLLPMSWPASTPTAVVATSASAADANTVQRSPCDLLANIMVASWVLSPSSATKTLVNTVAKSFQSMASG